MNCGERSYLGGEITDWFIPEGIQATEFALEIWGYEPPELDLVKNSTGTDYINVENKSYRLIEILGKPALFSDVHICPEDIPEGIFCYNLRVSDDGDWFAVAEPKVTVNYGGSIITNEPLDLGESGYIPLDEDTEPNFTGEELTIGEFMNSKFEQEQGMGGCNMKIVMLIVGLFVGSCTTLTVMSCLIINRYNDYESEIRRLKAKLENKDK